MFETSICESPSINLRTKGMNVASGKIRKGCVKDAATKLSIGSIPSTYESIIYKVDSKKAFGTSEQRFYNKNKGQNQEMVEKFESSLTETATTQSTKPNTHPNVLGYGPLISKSKRELIRTVKTPGPGQYDSMQSQNQNKKQLYRKCFTRQQNARRNIICQRTKNKNLCEEQANKNKENILPGPGEYFTEKCEQWDKGNKGWKSSFETKVKRDHYIMESISPGPGVYEYARDSWKKKEKQNSKEKSGKINQKDSHKSPTSNLLIDIIREDKFEVPGPGSYDHNIPDFKPIYEKVKISKNFIFPLKPKKSKKSGPTATQYNIKRMYDNLSPKLIQSAVFMSESKRGIFNKQDIESGKMLNIAPENQKHFHLNLRNQWV